MKRKRTTVKDYPSNWKTEIVPQVTARACGKCERCGLSHGQTVWLYIKDGKKHWSRSFSNAKLLGNAFPEKQIKVVCAVAHLDHDEWNKDVSMDRLRYLCQKCHLELDYDDNLRRIREMTPSITKERKIKNITSACKRKKSSPGRKPSAGRAT